MTPKKQKRIEIINDCGAHFHYGELVRAILWISERPVFSWKHVFMYGKYPAISVHGRKIHIHRLLASYYIGKWLPRNLVIHHKDRDSLNSLKDNLTIFPNGRHVSLHNKGKKLTTEHKHKISIRNRNRKGIPHKKRIYINLWELRRLIIEGRSINSIAKYFKCDWSTIKSRIHDNPELLK